MKIWKILNPFILQEKACSEENIRVWLSNYLIEIMGTTHGLDQLFQQKPGVQMGSYQQKRCQFELKGTEKNKMKSRLSDFLDPTEPTIESFVHKHALFSKKRRLKRQFRDCQGHPLRISDTLHLSGRVSAARP